MRPVGAFPLWSLSTDLARVGLPVHVRFGSKATDWPVVGQLTSFMSTRPSHVESKFAALQEGHYRRCGVRGRR